MTARWSSVLKRMAATTGLISLVACGVLLDRPGGGGAALAAVDDSSLSVSWRNDNSVASQYQPSRDAAAPAVVAAFSNLTVTVSQTSNLQDQSIRVSVSGMGATYANGITSDANNFVQVMQCWGPDPLAADFAKTCQFGAAGGQGWESAASRLTAAGAGQYVMSREDYPFRSVSGRESQGTTVSINGSPQYRDGLSEFFTPSSSNEIPILRIDSNGRGSASFEVQTAASAPHLGCGDAASAAGSRCWLVVVPRGERFSATMPGDRPCVARSFLPPTTDGTPRGTPGAAVYRQVGSPVAPWCSHFNDRIVVPLDFQPARVVCPAGAPEELVVGTELATRLLSSWQSALCTVGAAPATFSYVTNSGSLFRSQLLRGQSGMVLTGEALTPANVGGSSSLLESADIVYGPIANTGLVIGFVAENPNVGTVRNIKLTPRLVAKMLTQSYTFDVPFIQPGIRPDLSHIPLSPQSVDLDPEWRALGNPAIFGAPGALVVLGPQGDDAFGLLWRWIQADDKARAWLAGEPDNVLPGDEGNSGMAINPYFLPNGDPRALGGGLPFDISTDRIDFIPRADQTVIPTSNAADNGYLGLQVDSVSMQPYATSFAHTATRILKADTQHTSIWDPAKWLGGAQYGAFVSGGPIPPGLARLAMGPMDAATARTYGLDVADLQLPNRPGTFAGPTDAAISAAAATALPSDTPGVTQIDMSRLPDDGYPLTTTVYAAVNRTETSPEDDGAQEYASFLRYAAGPGQVAGELRGQLPAGYVALTEPQGEQTRLAASKIDGSYVEPAKPTANGSSNNGPTVQPSGTSGSTATSNETSDEQPDLVTASESSPAQGSVGGVLVVAIALLIAAPILMFRRRVAGP